MQKASMQNARQDFGEKFGREAEDVAGVGTSNIAVVRCVKAARGVGVRGVGE
jgi:hypothetical protein